MTVNPIISIYATPKRDDRERKGCDSCKRDLATQKFFGMVGGVLWVCGSCYKKMVKVSRE